MKWKSCSNCKKDILFGRKYQACSVSTCNHPRKGVVFCSVSCWSAHVPIMRHKNSWAEERTAPLQEGSTPEDSRAPKRIYASSNTPSSIQKPAEDKPTLETLVVVSKLKNFVKEATGHNTSADTIDFLSDHIRTIMLQASRNAQSEGRRTVMARDFSFLNHY